MMPSLPPSRMRNHWCVVKRGGKGGGNGAAYANGTALPRRFGTWFFGNGIIPERWNPTTTGTGNAWKLSSSLEPLLLVKPWLTVVSGLRVKIPNTFAHKSMPANVLTGAQAVQSGDVLLPSIDHKRACRPAGQRRCRGRGGRADPAEGANGSPPRLRRTPAVPRDRCQRGDGRLRLRGDLSKM